MSGTPNPTRRRLSRVMIVAGILMLIVGVVRMNTRALGGVPEHPGDFSQRRPYNQVKRAVREGFPEFLMLASGGLMLLFGGVRVGRDRSS